MATRMKYLFLLLPMLIGCHGKRNACITGAMFATQEIRKRSGCSEPQWKEAVKTATIIIEKCEGYANE